MDHPQPRTQSKVVRQKPKAKQSTWGITLLALPVWLFAQLALLFKGGG